MNFTPSDKYAELRTQARALATLADSLQKQLTRARNDAAELRRKLALTGDAAIQAERATNEQLTAALEAADALEAELRARVAELDTIINAPQSDDFLRAVSTEAEHQRQRWGSEHDAGKTPADWFWLVGYLAGKALHAHASGNLEKVEHHIITTAAACANWHRAMLGKTDMRPGIADGEWFAAPQEEV